MIGVLLIDKPVGQTSTDVVRRVRSYAGTRRVGHAGTLDPTASGLLLVCVGEATKVVSYLMSEQKEYITEGTLGTETLTDDAGSESITSADWAHVRREQVEQFLAESIGTIEQRPPRVSAIKRDGERFYKRVRRGEEVDADLPLRTVQAHEIHLEEWAPPSFRLRMVVGKGFYVRSLIRDLGRSVESAAHVRTLRRSRIGRFNVRDATALSNLNDAAVIPMNHALSHLPTLMANEEAMKRIQWGQKLRLDEGLVAPAGLRENEPVRVLGPNEQLIAIATLTPDQVVKVLRGFQTGPPQEPTTGTSAEN
jgi:tRNA pseudouridine55 synthase